MYIHVKEKLCKLNPLVLSNYSTINVNHITKSHLTILQIYKKKKIHILSMSSIQTPNIKT